MNDRRIRGLVALATAGTLAGALAGCSETAIQGSVLDQDVSSNPNLQISLARGSNSEVTDIMTVGTGYKYWVLSGTDDFLNAGTAGGEERAAIGQWDRDQGNDQWEQAMEGAWSGLKVVNNAMEAFTPEEFQVHPIVARGYLNSAHSERLIGDMFCEAVYGFGPNGGLDLDNLGDATFTQSTPVGKDSIFRRMATVAELAVEAAQRSVDAGAPNPSNADPVSDALFDPQNLLWASHAAAAQAYHALAVLGVDVDESWDRAVAHAAEVPTAFVEVTIHDPQVEINELWDITWDNDDVTLFGEIDGSGNVLGVPATALWPDDPRVAVQDCTVDDAGCDDTESEGEGWPMWVPLKYPDEGADDEMVTGTEMRLIEAEEALVRRMDFNTFYNKIDEARAHHGADPLTFRPTVVGELEWPNAEDDAMSILDRERYLELWLEGRRLFDLYRWNHPFITENRGLIPRHDELLQQGSRAACMAIAESECNLNGALGC